MLLTLLLVVFLVAVHDFQGGRYVVQSLLLPASHGCSPRRATRRSALHGLRMGFDTVVRVSSRYEAPCAMACDGGVSLTDYMRLPVDQYVCIRMPLDATLERVSGTRFNMTVPPVRFFNLDVSPTIMCDVTQSDDSVRIVSDECILRGSPYVVGLNGCFRMRIVSEFRWTDRDDRRAISSASDIYVEVDPPPPFKFFGKTILEKTGKLALSIALSQIENAFVQSLARDYERWATDQMYRITRASNSCDIDGDRRPVVTATATATTTATATATATTTSVEDITAADADDEPSATDMALVGAEDDIILVESVVTKESPPVLTDDICLLPGSDPIVRVEEAPTNSRRIFTGVDIMAPMEAVWDVLTAYERLQDVVPSLVRNRVLERTPDGGARLAQVGGAKVSSDVSNVSRNLLSLLFSPPARVFLPAIRCCPASHSRRKPSWTCVSTRKTARCPTACSRIACQTAHRLPKCARTVSRCHCAEASFRARFPSRVCPAVTSQCKMWWARAISSTTRACGGCSRSPIATRPAAARRA